MREIFSCLPQKYREDCRSRGRKGCCPNDRNFLVDVVEPGLRSLLDSALFLALLIQLAAAVVYLPSGGDVSQYEGTLIMYTAIIPVCSALALTNTLTIRNTQRCEPHPVPTLTNTPTIRKNIQGSELRLAMATLAVGSAGGVIFRGTKDLLSHQAELDKAVAENKPDPFRCVSSFLMRIMPAVVEARMLRCLWVLAAVALFLAFALYVETEIDGDTSTTQRGSMKQTWKRVFVVFQTLYPPAYLGMQFLQFFLLSRIYWMRKMMFNIINPNIAVKYEADISKYYGQFVAARNGWADDKWGFGQITSLSLWIPAILEMIYLTLGMPQLFQPVLYVQLANGGLATINGKEPWIDDYKKSFIKWLRQKAEDGDSGCGDG